MSKSSRWYTRPLIITGVILFLIGIATLIIPHISYSTHEKLLELGPIKATTETKKYFLIPPVIGLVTSAVGALLAVFGFIWKKR
jgi:hypothetical protein